jgi:outer membrane protein assembly factor BamD
VDVGRDQKITEQALKSLQDVVHRFPDSKYAKDAKLKLDFTRDHLAGKEMEIGRYYLKRGQYLAAMNRFKRVVDDYQSTTHVPEALERLIECDLALGLTNEARRNAAVLGYNYPGSKWYQDGYELVTKTGIPGTKT